MRLKSLMILNIFLNTSLYAENYNLNNNQSINTKINENKINIYLKKNNNENQLIDSLELPSDISTVNFLFGEKINNKQYIFLSVNYPDSYRDAKKLVEYKNDYNHTFVYECNTTCIYNDKISSYFGNGGDVYHIKIMKTLYKFPFSDLKSVKDEIGSRTFSSWINGNITTGTIINKKNIYETNNYSLNRIAYLIKDDKFKVKKSVHDG